MTWLDTKDQTKVNALLAEAPEKFPDWAERLADADGDARFALHMLLVDRALVQRVGFGHRDLEDWLWFDSYEAGDSPHEAMKLFLADQVTLA
jgi:hypothetical protein